MVSLGIRHAVCGWLVLVHVQGLILLGPLHASCKIKWSFPSLECETVAQKIVSQAKTWENADNCANGGEKCLYKITEQSATTIKGTHTTPKKKYVDDISFSFSDAVSGCSVEGYSTSETWYAVLDYGTNYCNLHNLITGSGLNTTQGYTESTSNSVCTQYSSADCDKY